ncbi:M23 family metallopeptidase [Pseudooceanicola spongiae]|uniref:Peptidoglycan DD-metalloendopeptidase family protein n=1 Tax=Pseudooceanicola spongiae TaxID=2613965 RepID=A0A7L9WK43_9RHOB|nr:M23 family metallopeptidase [Pseudooceanicola spongiae]QOL80609.1 peptidoglycan DD-metalloendopeptidase family protein [Pseudooceanicola spongiae]
MTGTLNGFTRLVAASSALALLAACNGPMDADLRGGFGGFSTADAALGVAASRPSPDNRGIISYPGYQVVVARRDDTVNDVAARVGADPAVLARYNGLNLGDRLNDGAVLALPSRVSEPSPATGSPGTGPIMAPSDVGFTQMAGSAIERAADKEISVATLPPSSPGQPARQVGEEPIRHRVVRGETAYTVARLYGVSVRSLSEWNGLDANFTIREGQYLLIPLVSENGTVARPPESTTAPGVGSPTPLPPSASKPLPAESPAALATAPVVPKTDSGKTIAPDLSKEQAAPSGKLGYPVQGRIIREYEKGKSDGIDLAADPGVPVKAAGSGTVAAIIQDTDNRSVIVVKHADNLLTLYSNVEGITAKKGDSVERGQQIAKIATDGTPYLHFEVRKGLDTVDPMTYLK